MPKSSSDHLFLLIHAMSAPEKRYFRRFLLLYGGKENVSAKLFDAFSRQKVYDEAALKRSATYLSGFAQHKKRLGELLLRSLRAYHADATTEMRINAHLGDAEIFRTKRLYAAGTASLKKAAKLAKSIHDPLAQLEALHRSDRLLFDARQPAEFAHHAKTLAAETALLEEYTEIIRSKSTAKQQYHRHYFAAQTGKKISREETDPPHNIHALRYHLLGRAASALAAGRMKEAYRYAVKHVTLLEQNAWLINDHPYEYVKALSTQLVLQDLLQLHAESAKTIAQLRQLHRIPALGKKLKQFESHTFTYTYTTEFNSLVQQGAYTRAAALIPVISKGLERHEKTITAAERKVFHFNFALLHFYLHDPKQLFRWATRALSDDPEIRTDLHYMLHVLRMVSTFDRNDPDFLSVLVKKEGPLLTGSGIAPAFTAALLNFFQQLAACTSPKEVKTTCSNFRDQLKTPRLKKEATIALVDFDLNGWLERKAAGKK
jgi:hypothetical protein